MTTTSMQLQQSLQNYVGGEWVDTAEHDVVRLPYDGTPVGEVPRAGRDLVERAVAAAREGFHAMRELAHIRSTFHSATLDRSKPSRSKTSRRLPPTTRPEKAPPAARFPS